MSTPVSYESKSIFKAFIDRSIEKRILPDRIAKLFLQKATSLQAPLRILDIGCHDGSLTLGYVRASLEWLPKNTEVIGIDPSRDAIDEFRKADLPKEVSFSFFNGTLQEYVQERSDEWESGFDWIISSHSLYWESDLNSTLQKLFSRARALCIVIQGTNGIYQIRTKYKEHIPDAQFRCYSESDIEAFIQNKRLLFCKETIQNRICFPLKSDPDAKSLVAFLLQSSPQMLNDAVFDEIYRMISESSKDLYFDTEASIFMIHGA